jgi:uncharacterized protein (TIGR03437 family)
MRLTILNLALAGVMLAQQPTSTAIANAASGESEIARGGFFSIYGANLGERAGPPSSLPLPTTLGRTQVRIRPVGSTTTFDAYLHFVAPTQVNGILPSNVPEGDADITVVVGTVTSPPRRVRVVRNRFGIFTIGSLPRGLAVVQNYESPTSLPLNLFTKPAKPEQVLILYGTGLGPYTAGPDNAAPGAGNLMDNVEVLVAGISVRAAYAGRAPGFPGVDQINFSVPAAAPDGCYVPVQIKVGTVLSSTATIAKTISGRPCEHPFGLSEQDLNTLQLGGTLSAGVVHLMHSRAVLAAQGDFSIGSISDTVESYFERFAANGINETRGGMMAPLSLVSGSCVAGRITSSSDPRGAVEGLVEPPGNAYSTRLDPGALTLNGGGRSFRLEDIGAGLGATLAEGADIPGVSSVQGVLGPGAWTLAGSGGRHVSAFSATFQLPEMLRQPDGNVTITRGQSLTVRWAGGGGEQDTVAIVGWTVPNTLTNPTNRTVTFFQCQAPASARSFNVPGEITGQLDADSLQGALAVTASTRAGRFTAPLVGGGTLNGAGFATMVDLNGGVVLR